MENNYFELRMYSLVLYQFKGIQQGIQTQHAITDYGQAHPENLDYKQWANKDKTTIILSAGGSIELVDAIAQLIANDITHKTFKEPDLYDMPTAVCFLVDERIWDKIKYPDVPYQYRDNMQMIADFNKILGNEKNIFLRSFLSNYRLA